MELDEKSSILPIQRKSPFFAIQFLPLKLIYLIQDGMFGSIIPFLAVFLTSIGLDVKEVGVIGATRLLAAAVSAPMWGYLADQTARRKLIFVILCTGTILAVLAIPLVGNSLLISNTIEHNRTASNNCNYTKMDPGKVENASNISLEYLVDYHGVRGTDCAGEIPNERLFFRTLFYVMFLVDLMACIFMNPICGIVDSFVMNIIKNSEEKVAIGDQKLFSAVGFGSACFLAGYIADHYSHGSLSKYTAVFYVWLPLAIILMPMGLIVARKTSWKCKEDNNDVEVTKVSDEINTNRLRIVISTLGKLDNTIFMLSTLLAGVSTMMIWGYLFIHMDTYMQASKTTMGLSTLMLGISEAIVFLFGDKLMRLLGGPIASIEVTLFATSIEYIILSYIENPWLVLLTQTVQGFAFALFWVSAVEHVQVITPKEIYITMFSLLASTYFNMAGFLANLIGGLIYSYYGAVVLFRSVGYLCLMWFVFMVIYYHIRRIRSYISRICFHLRRCIVNCVTTNSISPNV